MKRSSWFCCCKSEYDGDCTGYKVAKFFAQFVDDILRSAVCNDLEITLEIAYSLHSSLELTTEGLDNPMDMLLQLIAEKLKTAWFFPSALVQTIYERNVIQEAVYRFFNATST